MVHTLDFPSTGKANNGHKNINKTNSEGCATGRQDSFPPSTSLAKNNTLLQMAIELERKRDFLLAENAKISAFARKNGIHQAMVDRLTLKEATITAMSHFVDTLREPAWLMEMVPQVDVLVSAATQHQGNRGDVQ